MTDQDKLSADVKALNNEAGYTKIRDMLRLLGVKEEEIITVEKSEDIPVLMKARELVKEIGASDLFGKDENDRYNIYTKITAITILTASVGMMEDFGATGSPGTPYYAGVSEWLSIPVPSLRRWWRNQSVINREQIAVGSAAAQRMALKQIEIAELYTDGLLISKTEMKKLKETPKGVAVMIKVATQAVYLAKLLITQGDVISKADSISNAKQVGSGHKVAIIYPEAVKPGRGNKYQEPLEGEIKDGDDITDRE